MSDKILIVGHAYDMSYGLPVKDLGDITNNITDFKEHPLDYSLVLFTGGEDISPALYGHTSPNRLCHNNVRRDAFEKSVFEIAERSGIRMTGICRGAQFLNVMAGGTMVHHLDGHTGSWHDITTLTGEELRVNSLHHQMMLPPPNAHVVGWSTVRRATNYFGDKDLPISPPEKEVECVIFPNIQAAVVQYHPEMMLSTSQGFRWYNGFVKSMISATSFSDFMKEYGVNKCKKETQNTHAQ